jgi:hypothetical protein
VHLPIYTNEYINGTGKERYFFFLCSL